MKENILITGVAGFIGSNLLDYLIEQTEWNITGIDNLSTGSIQNIQHHLNLPRFVFVEKSVGELKTVKPFTKIFHLAALPRIQPSFIQINEHIEANVKQAVHLIELMVQDNWYPRFIYSGSSAIYGTPNFIPTPETEKVDCLSPYAFQKYEVERYLELIATRYPLDYVTLRYFNPYGPRSFNPENTFNAYSSVVGIFLNKKKNGQKLLVTGDGSQKRDFIHVKDLARANYLVSIHPNKINDAFNVGFGDTLSVKKLAQLIAGDEYTFIDKREGEAEVTFADNSKLRKTFGWAPSIDIQTYIKGEIESE